MRLKIILPLVASSTIAYAQPPAGHGENLVPNPGFEELVGKAPKDDIDGSAVFRYNCVDWKSPTQSTPDIKIVFPQQVKKAKQYHDVKIDAPHSGYKMAAILTHNPGSERSDTYREYMQVKLKQPLIEGKEYYCEFWAMRARQAKFISNNLGVVLSPTPLEGNKWDPLTDVPPTYNVDGLINKDGRQWERISFTFTAANRSQFLIIGNFHDNEKTKLVVAKDVPKLISANDEQAFENSYYMIDDVMLCLTQALPEEPEPALEPEPMPEPEPEPIPEPQMPEPKVGEKIQLDRVFFETAKWGLLEESNEQLDELVKLMNDYPQMEVEIHGHTDSRGSSSYNQKLSENRTKSVYQYLVDQGIDSDRMKYIGYGEAKPIEDNMTASGRQMNRRVEFVVVKIKDGVEVEQNNEVKPYTDKS
jgi:outer membrane protein OmpA-like peptidoglycan-associated protein/uncharacterized protein (DUF736 family)